MSKELLSIIKEDGYCNIDFRVSLDKLTKEELKQVVIMTYYALKTLEENMIKDEVKPNE